MPYPADETLISDVRSHLIQLRKKSRPVFYAKGWATGCDNTQRLLDQGRAVPVTTVNESVMDVGRSGGGQVTGALNAPTLLSHLRMMPDDTPAVMLNLEGEWMKNLFTLAQFDQQMIQHAKAIAMVRQRFPSAFCGTYQMAPWIERGEMDDNWKQRVLRALTFQPWIQNTGALMLRFYVDRPINQIESLMGKLIPMALQHHDVVTAMIWPFQHHSYPPPLKPVPVDVLAGMMKLAHDLGACVHLWSSTEYFFHNEGLNRHLTSMAEVDRYLFDVTAYALSL